MKGIFLETLVLCRRLIDVVLSILLVPSGAVMFLFRRYGAGRLPVSSGVLKKIGVWPIRDHYYEPFFNDTSVCSRWHTPRELPGIDFNISGQLKFLESLKFGEEFKEFVARESSLSSQVNFNLQNDSFGTGDSDFLYQFLRCVRPNLVIEIGSGNSTKIAHRALEVNASEDSSVSRHVCFEPYEQPWLESFTGIELIRTKVEDYDFAWGSELMAGDLLFIDSSHMIRPRGDVLFEYLYILPQLQSGVYVHVHDIFSPRDYPESWVRNDVLFWNEQYLLEALLSNSSRYQVVASLNHLQHDYYDALKAVCPFLIHTREPGSFYFKVL